MRSENLGRLNKTSTNKYDINFLVYVYLFEDIKNAVKKFGKGNILDVGCGNKPYKIFFKNYDSYLGCDIVQSSENEVDVICDVTNIPLESSKFDTVICTQTIEHVFDHNKMISEIGRVLKTGGNLILTGPMYWPHHEEPYDFFRFTKYGFESLLQKNNFKIIDIKPNGGKWSLWGLVTLHTLPTYIANLKIVKYLINSLCYRLDKKSKNFYKNTSNFIVVAQKNE